MTTRLRHVAPAGAPIGWLDLVRWAQMWMSTSDAASELRRLFCREFSVRHSVLSSTGRAGMTLLLRAMHRLAPDRHEVIIPSYTCYSVAASIMKAGLRPRIIDISPATLDYVPDLLTAADYRHVLAIVATNLYGLPNDLPSHVRTAREHGVFLVDDAAQAMGGYVGGRRCGTWGDAGLYSFDKGKNVSAIDGGVIVTDSDDIAGALAQEMAVLPRPDLVRSGANVVKAMAYFALLRPSLYWIPNSVPQLELGKTVFTTDFALGEPGRALITLAITMMGHLDGFTRARVANAERLLQVVSGVPGVRFVKVHPAGEPAFLRLPILVEDAHARPKVLAVLRAAGIGATRSYPASLADVPDLQGELAASASEARGGRYVAEHIVTLPTHPFVAAADIERTVAALATIGMGPMPASVGDLPFPFDVDASRTVNYRRSSGTCG